MHNAYNNNHKLYFLCRTNGFAGFMLFIIMFLSSSVCINIHQLYIVQLRGCRVGGISVQDIVLGGWFMY